MNALDAFTTPQESRAALDKARNSLTDMLSVSGNSTSPALRLSMLLYAREAHSFAVGAFDPKTSPTLEYASAVYPGMYHMASALKLIRATPELTGEHKKIAEEFAKDMHIGAMKIYAVALGMPDAPQRRDLPTPSELAGEQWKQWEPQGHEYQQHQGQRR